jgi:hypothetical protein
MLFLLQVILRLYVQLHVGGDKRACKGRSIPMEKLDRLLTERLADKLLTPERIGTLLVALMERQAAKDEDYSTRLTTLRAKLADAEARLGRLYAAIESGLADPGDSTLKERIASVKVERDIALVALDRALSEMRPAARITEEKIAAFVEIMRTNVLSGDTPFRRAYIRSVIDQVEVDDAEIRIFGRKTVLERLVMGGGASPAGVPSFVRKWRAWNDSNYCCRFELAAQEGGREADILDVDLGSEAVRQVMSA